MTTGRTSRRPGGSGQHAPRQTPTPGTEACPEAGRQEAPPAALQARVGREPRGGPLQRVRLRPRQLRAAQRLRPRRDTPPPPEERGSRIEDREQAFSILSP